LAVLSGLTDSQSERELTDIKAKVKQLTRRIGPNSEPQASIEGGQYNIQYVDLH
jgi:vesicle transport protein SEC22